MKRVTFEHESYQVGLVPVPDEQTVALEFLGLGDQGDVSGSVWLPAAEARELAAYLIEFAYLAEAPKPLNYEQFRALPEAEQRAYVERAR